MFPLVVFLSATAGRRRQVVRRGRAQRGRQRAAASGRRAARRGVPHRETVQGHAPAVEEGVVLGLWRPTPCSGCSIMDENENDNFQFLRIIFEVY